MNDVVSELTEDQYLLHIWLETTRPLEGNLCVAVRDCSTCSDDYFVFPQFRYPEGVHNLYSQTRRFDRQHTHTQR